MVKCEDIVKKFNIGTPDETTLFDRFSFEVQEGEFVSIAVSYTHLTLPTTLSV